MLSAEARLHRTSDIAFVMRRGRRLHTPYVRIHLVRRPQQERSRVACIVGRAVSPLAVRRHQYQRWLRATARLVIPHLPAAYDMVWVALPTIKRAGGVAVLHDSINSRLQSFTSQQ